MDSTERGGAGPSATEGAPCACRATVTVLRGALACMRPRGGQGSIGAAPNGVASWRCLLLAATGGFATVEAANSGDARRHRHLCPSKGECGALAREERPSATRQGAQLIDDKSLTKNDTVKL